MFRAISGMEKVIMKDLAPMSKEDRTLDLLNAILKGENNKMP